MANKRRRPEGIVTKLRQVEGLTGQGMPRLDAIRQIGGEPLCAIGSRTMASEPPRCPERVGQDVERPAFARPQSLWHRCSRSPHPFPTPSSRGAQFLPRVQPVERYALQKVPRTFC